jgi:type I restriction enzyme S subunit
MSDNSNHTFTEIEKIPEDWEVTVLGDERFVKIARAGGTPLRSIKEYYEGGDIPFVKIEDMTRGQKYLSDTVTKITKLGLNNSSTWVVPPKSVLFSMYASYGEAAITEVPMTTNQAIIALVPRDIEDCDFLYYVVRHLKPALHRHLRETTQENLNAEIVKSLRIPLPPVSERRRIGTILSTVDDAIQKTDDIIGKTQQLKKGLMQQLLTKGLGHIKFKRTDIGEIPEEWRVTRLQELTLKIRRGPSKRTNTDGIGIVYLTSDYIDDDGSLRFDALSYLKESEIDDLNKYVVETGDLIVNCVNSLEKIGKVGIFSGYKEKVMVGFNNFALTLDRNLVHPEFLKHFFLTRTGRNMLKNLSKSAVQQVSFSSKDLLGLKVPLPALSEQQEIASILTSVQDMAENEKQKRTQLEKLKKGLMRVLLTGKVRVKVN